MLQPVSQSSLSSGQHPTSLAVAPKSRETGVDLKQAAAQKADELELLSRYTGKLASLLVASQDSSGSTLTKLALSLARVLAFQQKDGENNADFGRRLADFILSLTPADRLEAEMKSGLKALGISARALAEALKNPGSALAARLVVLAEAPLIADRQVATEIVQQSYNLDSDQHHPVPDSLKYRSSPPQAAILSARLAEPDRQAGSAASRLVDARQIQDHISKAFLADQPESVAEGRAPVTQHLKALEQSTGQLVNPTPGRSATLPAKVLPSSTTETSTTREVTERTVSARSAPEEFPDMDAPLEPLPQNNATRPSAQQPTIARQDAPPPHAASVPPDAAKALIGAEMPAQPGLMAAVAERIARATGLSPKMSAQVLSETILKAATEIIAEEKLALATMAGELQQGPDPFEEPPVQTSVILKDLPKETMVKLQLLAEALSSQKDLESVLEKIAPKLVTLPAKAETAPEPDTEMSSSNTDMPESQIRAARIAASEIRHEKPDPVTAASLAASIAQVDEPAVGKKPDTSHPETGRLAPELLVQRLLTADMIAFATVPYPFAKNEAQVLDIPEDERRDDSDHDNDNRPEDNEDDGQRRKKEPVPEALDDNPFAAETELKRHPSDAERAFHMYQKMGGF